MDVTSRSKLDQANFDISNYLPVECSKHVSKDCTRLISKLPMMRNHVEFHHPAENRRYRRQDELIQEYLHPILLEIAEIRNTIKSLAPHLRNSQQYLQRKIFSYARHHTTYSRRIRSLRARVQKFPECEMTSNGNDCNFSSQSVLVKFWYRFMSLLVSIFTPHWIKKEKEQKRIEEAFRRFYLMNGTSFRLYLAQAMIRCKKLEELLSNLRLQMTNISTIKTEDNIAGIAAQVKVRRDEMLRWRKDVEYVWRETKNLRGIVGLLPVHNCWEAIYNIMLGRDQYNMYV